MSDAIIKCDKCGKEFQVNSIKLEEKQLPELLVSFFRCPFCKYAYPVKYTDKQQKLYDTEIQSCTQMIAQRRNLGKSVNPSRIRRLNSLFESSKTYQKALRDKYVTAVTTQLNQSGELETNSITGKEESHET